MTEPVMKTALQRKFTSRRRRDTERKCMSIRLEQSLADALDGLKGKLGYSAAIEELIRREIRRREKRASRAKQAPQKPH